MKESKGKGKKREGNSCLLIKEGEEMRDTREEEQEEEGKGKKDETKERRWEPEEGWCVAIRRYGKKNKIEKKS